jgi:hypothetical protein
MMMIMTSLAVWIRWLKKECVHFLQELGVEKGMAMKD